MQTIINSIENKILDINPWTNVYGVARSLLAMGTFLTLLFNDYSDLFIEGGKAVSAVNISELYKINIFYILHDYPIIAYYISLSVLALVISGWRPKITGIFHWWIAFSFFLSCSVPDGGDQISAILAFLILPICLTDNRKWHWDKRSDKVNFNSRLIAALSMFFIQVQVCIIYLHAAVAKLDVEEWLDGTALYYWLSHSTHGISSSIEPFLFPLFYNNSYVVVLFTWGTLFFEFILAFSIMIDKDKSIKLNFLMYSGIFFHLMICVFLGLFSFLFAMTGALILYLRPSNSEFSLKKIRKYFYLKRYISSEMNA